MHSSRKLISLLMTLAFLSLLTSLRDSAGQTASSQGLVTIYSLSSVLSGLLVLIALFNKSDKFRIFGDSNQPAVDSSEEELEESINTFESQATQLLSGGDKDGAAGLFIKAAEQYKVEGHIKKAANDYNRGAELYKELGKNTEATTYKRMAAEFYVVVAQKLSHGRNGNKKKTGMAYVTAANIYEEIHATERASECRVSAAECFFELAEQYRKRGENEQAAMCYSSAAEQCRILDQSSRASELYELVVQLRKE